MDTFNTGDAFISLGDNLNFRIIRQLPDEVKERIEFSTLSIISAQLYMHYWTGSATTKDPDDQNWQNQVLFFWKAEEPFPKKSLPPVFETYEVKHFVFIGEPENITLNKATAIPWFGMPGMGEKHFCELSGQKLTVPELEKMGVVQYVEPVELTHENEEVLIDRENYSYLLDERIAEFRNNGFYVQGHLVPLEVAYIIGGIHIVKKVKLTEF